MASTQRLGYSGLQIGLHWAIAALVLFQLVFGDSMGAVLRADARGTIPSMADQQLASLHYWFGIAILALAGVRLTVRLIQGAPPPSPGISPFAYWAAKVTHRLFYLLLIAVPVTGLLAYYLGNPWGDLHELAKPAFIVLIGLHAAAALFHQYWIKDGTLRRMLVPGS